MALQRLTQALALGALFLSAPALAREDWQLEHGPFLTAADVRPHNMLGQDRADILARLAAEAPDWAGALTLYVWGANFPWQNRTHSLGRFADNYNGLMAQVLPASVAHWDDPSFAQRPVISALAETGPFYRIEAAQRIAFVEGATLATILNWTRFELHVARTKALAPTPNWALTNGSPKNWNEIFAFYHGPDGRHSLHAAMTAAPGGAAIAGALYQVLAAGQEHLIAERWAEDEAQQAARLLDATALTLFHEALTAADTGADPLALMRARGLWLAAAEPVLTADPEAAAEIEAALAGDAALIGFAAETVAGLLATLQG